MNKTSEVIQRPVANLLDLIDVVILTYNEAHRIGDCLASLPEATHVLVVDSGSTDNTTDMVRLFSERLDVRVLSHRFGNFSAQRNWALSQCHRTWTLMIDADEVVPPEFWNELRQHFPGSEHAVVAVSRRNYWGTTVLPTGRDIQVKLFNRTIYRFTGSVHETLEPRPRRDQIIVTKSPLQHYTYDSVSDYLEKMLRYSRLVAQQDNAVSFRDYVEPLFHFLLVGIARGGLIKSRQSRMFTIFSTIYFYLILVYKQENDH